jgi:hypothetical protein
MNNWKEEIQMSKIIITKNMSQEQRLEAIRKASKKFNAKMQRNFKVRDYSVTAKEDRGDDSVNINAWTDAPKYLDEHYGDRAREQASYESDWG